VWVGGSAYDIALTVKTEFGYLGIARLNLVLDYSYARANMQIQVAEQITAPDRFDLAVLTQWSGSLRIPYFMRQLEQVDATDAPYDDSAEYTRVYGLLSGAENTAGSGYGPFYGFGDKNMPLGYTYFGKGLRQFRVTTPSTAVSNGGASAGVVTLSALLTLDAAAATPFTSVCFYYRQTGYWVSAGCTASGTSGGSGTTKTLDYRISWNPPATLGTSGSVAIRAIGMNSTGDGLATNTNSSVTLVP
jgi:hypothetical protein